MADTSGFGHYPGRVVFSGGCLNREKTDLRLIRMYDSTWPPHYDAFLLPVHITFDETEGRVSPLTLMSIMQNAPNLIPWSGIGKTEETFALGGIVSRGQLKFISNLPDIKFIWLLEDRSRWTYKWSDLQL